MKKSVVEESAEFKHVCDVTGKAYPRREGACVCRYCGMEVGR